MGAIINDWQSMRKFRGDMRETVENLQEQLRVTETAMDEVAQSWKDEQFRKYNEEFTKDKELISPLCKKMTEFEEGPLLQLEEIIHRYTDL